MGGPVTVEWRGKRFDPRTAKMLAEVARLTPKLPTLIPVQGSYNTSVGASAGTHNGGGAVDLSVRNLSNSQETELVRVMRRVGFAAWLRLASEGPWSEHIHGIAIGCKDLAPSAARQVTAYKNGRNGLKNNKPDTGPKVGFITWEQHQAKQEDDMPLNAADEDRIRKIVRGELQRPNTVDGPPKTTVSTRHGGRYSFLALREIGKANAKADAILEAIKTLPDVDGDALAATVAAAVKRLDAEAVAEQLEVSPKDD